MSPTDQRSGSCGAAIFESFAQTGAPGEHGDLSALAEQHIVVLDDDGRLLMAHPFAAHTNGARVEQRRPRVVGQLRVGRVRDRRRARPRARHDHRPGHHAEVDGDAIDGDAVFGVLVPAAHWWDDIGHT